MSSTTSLSRPSPAPAYRRFERRLAGNVKRAVTVATLGLPLSAGRWAGSEMTGRVVLRMVQRNVLPELGAIFGQVAASPTPTPHQRAEALAGDEGRDARQQVDVPTRPPPSSMRMRMSSSQPVPSRQGVHLPQPPRGRSSTRRATLTMDWLASMATPATEQRAGRLHRLIVQRRPAGRPSASSWRDRRAQSP